MNARSSQNNWKKSLLDVSGEPRKSVVLTFSLNTVHDILAEDVNRFGIVQ